MATTLIEIQSLPKRKTVLQPQPAASKLYAVGHNIDGARGYEWVRAHPPSLKASSSASFIAVRQSVSSSRPELCITLYDILAKDK